MLVALNSAKEETPRERIRLEGQQTNPLESHGCLRCRGLSGVFPRRPRCERWRLGKRCGARCSFPSVSVPVASIFEELYFRHLASVSFVALVCFVPCRCRVKAGALFFGTCLVSPEARPKPSLFCCFLYFVSFLWPSVTSFSSWSMVKAHAPAGQLTS